MLVLWGVNEELVVPAAIIGSILLLSFLAARDYLVKSESETVLDY